MQLLIVVVCYSVYRSVSINTLFPNLSFNLFWYLSAILILPSILLVFRYVKEEVSFVKILTSLFLAYLISCAVLTPFLFCNSKVFTKDARVFHDSSKLLGIQSQRLSSGFYFMVNDEVFFYPEYQKILNGVKPNQWKDLTVYFSYKQGLFGSIILEEIRVSRN